MWIVCYFMVQFCTIAYLFIQGLKFFYSRKSIIAKAFHYSKIDLKITIN